MPTDVLMHVGLMKSGTTFIQGRLTANADQLAEHGVLFPRYRRQVRATNDLHGAANAVSGTWDELAREIREHEGQAVLSMEFLGTLAPEKIARAVEDLGGRVRAVATLRDFGRTVPAMWQEAQQNRSNWGYAEYIEAVRTREGPGKVFWRQQGAGRIIRNWAQVLGPENVTVITVPPPGADRELLWDRFVEVAGLPELSWAEGERSNQSLGVASAVLMGRLNDHIAGVDRDTYNRRVKMFGKRILSTRRKAEGGIGFEVPDWLRRRSAEAIKRIRASGVNVVGDLDELTPLDVRGTDPDDISLEQQLEVAVDAIAELLRERDTKRSKARKSRS